MSNLVIGELYLRYIEGKVTTLYCVEINEQFFKKSPIFKENLPYFGMSN